MKEGDLVIVVGKMDNKIKDIDRNQLIIGTFLYNISEKRVVVLLPDGTLFLGFEYDIVPHNDK